jgi:aspartyl-tRNA(Asn)/glutamyl-tRNA(Gln) amidotransferase subunit B
MEKQTADYFEAVVKEGRCQDSSELDARRIRQEAERRRCRPSDKAPVVRLAWQASIKLIAKGNDFWQDCQESPAGNVDEWQICCRRVVKEQGLVQITDTGAIEEIVKSVIAANPQSVAD